MNAALPHSTPLSGTPASCAQPNAIGDSAVHTTPTAPLSPRINPMRCAPDRSVHAVVITPPGSPEPPPRTGSLEEAYMVLTEGSVQYQSKEIA